MHRAASSSVNLSFSPLTSSSIFFHSVFTGFLACQSCFLSLSGTGFLETSRPIVFAK